MRLFTRLAWIMVLLVALPGLSASWMARNLLTRSLNVGLNEEIGGALDAGLRQSREQYERLGRDLGDSLAVWVAESVGRTGGARGDARVAAAEADGLVMARVGNSARPQAGGEVRATALEVVRAAAGPAGARLPGREVVLELPSGSTLVLREGAPDTSTADPPRGAPPRKALASRTLPDGSVLTVRSPTSAAWQTDAQTIAAALRAVRGLKYLRHELLQAFWVPFLWIYAVSLLAAVAVAGLLASGLLVPVRRLVLATQEVGAGNWDVRVAVTGRDEISRLSERFNDMIRRLAAQSRQLVYLETMAGWREMARVLAHEVRNPLTPIQLTVEEMRERYRGDDREYAALLQECSRIVIAEVESLRNVVARFRDFSRPVEPRFTPVDLNALAADVGALQRDLRVELDLAPDLGTIRADDDRLRQVLMNLARNAQTATTGRASPCLRLATRAAGETVILEVEDNGPGIAAGERERVFEPYRSGSKGGLGLGLALVKGIVLAHGGSVRVEDGRLGGACFHIELPRDPEVLHG